MLNPENLSIQDYDYHLPEDRIAQYPLPERDLSKLLIYDKGEIRDDRFKNIVNHLPGDSLLVFNETRVIQARLLFRKKSGARIEVFCLVPLYPVSQIELAFQQRSPVTWKCMIGNLKKWKSGRLELEFEHDGQKLLLSAEKHDKLNDTWSVEFRWTPPHYSFSEILDKAGHVPLPPYIHRKDIHSDKDRYQTVYARQEGSVAAPTAGLHFTGELLDKLARKNIETSRLVLHVGAGTFKPVDVSNILDHEMHTEKVQVDRSLVDNLLKFLPGKIIAVGTTSTRTLESLYWLGVKLMLGETVEGDFHIKQWDPYQVKYSKDIPVHDALNAIARHMDECGTDMLKGATQMIIVPGYHYKIVSGLITNFHMPRSTLLMLVAALVGEGWRKVYDHALSNDYRLLSYGDSCLFLPR